MEATCGNCGAKTEFDIYNEWWLSVNMRDLRGDDTALLEERPLEPWKRVYCNECHRVYLLYIRTIGFRIR